MAKKSVKSRLLFGSLMILILAGLFAVDIWQYQKTDHAVYYSPLIAKGLLITVLAVLLALAGSLETIHLARQTGAKPLTAIILVGAALLTVWPYLAVWAKLADASTVIAAFFFILVAGQMIRRQTQGAGINLAWSIFAILYMGLFLSYVVAIRVHFGPGPLILLIAAVKFSDIGAYFTGMAFGRHKLIPWLSPGKTIEGFIGANIFSIAITALLCRLPIITYNAVLAGMHTIHFVLLGIGFAAVGHLGDLAESLLKRDAQVKDSAHLLPEFGGVLDLVDSILPTGFLWFLVLKYIL